MGEEVKPLFSIRFVGEELHPYAIPASDLAELIIAAERTILALAMRERPEREEEILVGLAQVEDKSIGLAFASNDEATVLRCYQETVVGSGQPGFSFLARADARRIAYHD